MPKVNRSFMPSLFRGEHLDLPSLWVAGLKRWLVLSATCRIGDGEILFSP